MGNPKDSSSSSNAERPQTSSGSDEKTTTDKTIDKTTEVKDDAKSKKSVSRKKKKSTPTEAAKSEVDSNKTINVSEHMGHYLRKQLHERYLRSNFNYRPQDVLKVLMLVKRTLKAEKSLARMKLPCVIVGDIHGQYADLLRVFQLFNEGENPGYLKQRFVFLGDYVDRGPQSLECIMILFLMKVKFPESFCLLRGNHETPGINRVYGFYQELHDRFPPKTASNLWGMFNDAFSYLPIACLIGKTILAMHGGISQDLKSLEDIEKIPRPLLDPSGCKLAMDLMWADPMINLQGFEVNEARGCSMCFGEDEVEALLKRLDCKLIVRAHQMMMNGFNFFADRKLLTIFTATSYYPGKANRGAVAYVNARGHVGFKILVPTEEGRGLKHFLGIHEEANAAEDTGYFLKKEEKDSNRQ